MQDLARRAQLSQLLTVGTRRKLAARADIAVEPLEQAYRLARSPTRMLMPWPQVTAYRLGHALLPLAHKQPELLTRIASLFEEAGANGILGPWPHVYRMAALHRLGSSHGPLQNALERAIAAYDNWYDRSDDVSGAPIGTRRTDLYNLIDLAAHFVNADPGALGARGVRRTPEVDQPPQWRLIVGSQVSMTTGTLARVELHAIAEHDPGALLFILPLGSGQASLRLPGAQVWERESESTVRAIAAVARGTARSLEQLVEAVYGRTDDTAKASLRQLRRRLRDKFSATRSAGATDVIEKTAKGGYRITNGLLVCGAQEVDWASAIP